MKLIWLDLETTGLDERVDFILEVGCIVTDEKLTQLGSFHALINNEYKERQHCLDPFVMKMHTESGLLKDLNNTATSYSDDVGTSLRTYLKSHNVSKADSYFAGSSIHFDWRFIRQFWPEIPEMVHYRMLDVSALKIDRQLRGLQPAPKTIAAHRAIQDCEASIAEYKWYRENRVCLTT